MVRTPLQIIFEILIFIVVNSINAILTIIGLLGELFVSLTLTAQTSVVGLILAIVIGGLFVIFMSKYLFKTTISLIKIILIYGAFVLVLIIILALFFSIL